MWVLATKSLDAMIPYGRQHIAADDIESVVRALASDFLTTGPLVDEFEMALARKCGVDHGVACSSGTAALYLASSALLASCRDTPVAIVPTMTFTATAGAPALAGARVVFADVDPSTGLMTAENLEEAVAYAAQIGTPKLVLPVHLNGQVAPMKAICDIARRHGMVVVEDACHALGGTYTIADGEGNGMVGDCTFSDASCFSFHPVKTFTMGEGGAVCMADSELARYVKRLRSHGLTRETADFTSSQSALDGQGRPEPWHYEIQDLSLNFRVPDILCALGLSQLNKLDTFVARRRSLFEHYARRLAPYADLVRPLEREPGQDPSWHLMVVHIDFASLGIARGALVRALRDEGICTQVHYIPLHRQPLWQAQAKGRRFDGGERYFARSLSLPLFYDMTEDQVDRVVDTLVRIVSATAKSNT